MEKVLCTSKGFTALEFFVVGLFLSTTVDTVTFVTDSLGKRTENLNWVEVLTKVLLFKQVKPGRKVTGIGR